MSDKFWQVLIPEKFVVLIEQCTKGKLGQVVERLSVRVEKVSFAGYAAKVLMCKYDYGRCFLWIEEQEKISSKLFGLWKLADRIRL